MSNIMLFSGNANPQLTRAVAEHLGISLGRALVTQFSDGETQVEILDNVRGKDVFVLQSTCPPVNDHLMEVVVMADALRRASASRITAVMPYFGYGRQDRRVRSMRVPITARVVADILVSSGIDRVLTVDLHAEQIQGFFNNPLDNVYATPVMLDYINTLDIQNAIVVSPDIGGVARARAFAKYLNIDLAIIDKRRPSPNESKVMNIIGDVEGRHCLIIDDIVDTAGTLCKAAEALIEKGASGVSAYCVHPVLSGQAYENLKNSQLTELVVTDSISLSDQLKALPNVKQLTLSKMLAESIRRINSEESISALFSEYETA